MISIIIHCFFRSGIPVSQSRLNEVFLSQRPVLLRTLQRMVSNRSTAEDLLQETYLRVTRALSSRAIDHLEPFVYQTARNLALDHLRSRRVLARTVADDTPQADIDNVVAQATSPERSRSEQAMADLGDLNTDIPAPVSGALRSPVISANPPVVAPKAGRPSHASSTARP
jgi:RNA polymerase sigma factor (sigma-70 family)